MREWRNANDNNHCHDCSVLLPKPKAQARQDTAVHVSLSVSTMSNSYPKVLPRQVETAPTGRLARQLVIGLERISINSTQMPMEQEKPAGQKCAPRLLIDRRCERCVYGPRRLVSKGFWTKKSFFFIFSLTLSVVVGKSSDPLFTVVARASPDLMPPSKCQTPMPLDIIGGLSAF